MEPLWSPVVATGGNRRQMDGTQTRGKKPNPLLLAATGCVRRSMVRRGLRFESGRGLRKRPAIAGFALGSACRVCLAGWNGSRYVHPWILRGVGVCGSATAIDRFGLQFVMPGLVAVDLTQPIVGAVFGQPRGGTEAPDVD